MPEPEQSKPFEVISFVAPCRDLKATSPLQWLALGWEDFKAAKSLSLSWGLISVLLMALVAWAAWLLGSWILLISVLSGFVFIAPLLAFALYSVSRQLRLGMKPTLGSTLRAARAPFSNALVFALVLLVVFLLWARAGSMVHIFFPVEGKPGAGQLVTFLAVGSAVGSVFALVSFAASAFSLPFIANREVDVVTAIVSSINAVMRNKWTMFCWASIIVIFTAVGLATALLGFIVIIPWLAYATWHGYRAALDVSHWTTLPAPN
ncbi:MAG TPA: DUF2189 domain-containing protein [Xanthomonadales bacterium]|nr:DUF2189 domain-containing protein [Xanthomonadales bacterium]